LLVCSVRVGALGADAQPVINKEAEAIAGTNNKRIEIPEK
jgi:hypothetical protein